MGKCLVHPDRETSYLCQKHNIYMCEECLRCRDPEIYCKFRSACPIWFMSKRKAGWDADKKAEDEIPRYKVAFLPNETSVTVSRGAMLMDAAQKRLPAATAFVNEIRQSVTKGQQQYGRILMYAILPLTL